MTQEQKSTEVALITGSNRGIGLQWCKHLLKHNFNVIATCRNPSKAEELKKLQQSNKDKLTIEKLDVISDNQIKDLSNKLKNKPIDLLILNAGIVNWKKFGDITRKELMEILNINTVSNLMIVQSFYNNVKISNRKLIIGMSSGLGSIGDIGSHIAVPYRISQAAFNMTLANIAMKSEEDKDGVHILAVVPGFVKTDMGGNNAEITVEESINNQWNNVITKYKTIKNGSFYSHKGFHFQW